MGGYDIETICKYFKVGDVLVMAEFFDHIIDGDTVNAVKLYKLNSDDIQHHEPCYEDEIKNAKQLETWMHSTKKETDFIVNAKDFENCLVQWLHDALYWNYSLDDLPEKKSKKIIKDFIKLVYGDSL